MTDRFTRSRAFTRGRELADHWHDPSHRMPIMNELVEMTSRDPVKGMMLLLAFSHFRQLPAHAMVDEIQSYLAPDME